MTTISIWCDTLAEAVYHQKRLLNDGRFVSVQLVRRPASGEAGMYAWKIN